MRIVDHAHHAENVFLVDDDARKTKYAPGRIVRMDCHVDVILVAHRHDALQKILQVGKQFFIVNVLVHGKKLFDVRHALRLPARHDAAVGIPGDGLEHFLRIEGIHSLLGVSEDSRTVRTFSGEFRAGPVENRHEVIAYEMDIFFSEIFQCLNVVINVEITVRCAGFDGVVDVDALDTGNMKSCGSNFRL